MNFSLFIIPIILTTLFETLFKLFFQVRFLSMITPRKLKLSTHSICIQLILTIGNLICFYSFLNILNFDLAELSDYFFTFNQVLNSANSSFNLLFLLRFLKLANNVVSSAYTMNLDNLLEKEISFK